MYRDELCALQARIRTLESDLRAEQKRREAEAAAAHAARAACDEAWLAARGGRGGPRRWPARLALGLLAGSLAISLVYAVWVRDRAEERVALLRSGVVRAELSETKARFENAACDAELRSERGRCARAPDPLPRGESLRRPFRQLVVAGRPEVRGMLDRELIRRVIRNHLSELKACVQRELRARPNLTGRVVAHFVIAADGRVVSSLIAQSTLDHEPTEECIRRSVGRWLFPKPAGGVVIVSYPFVFRSAAED